MYQQPPFSYFLNCRLNSPQVANVVFRKLDLASGYKLDVTKLFFGQPQMKLWSRYPINHKMFSFIILTGNTFIFFIAKFFFVIFFQLQTLATQPPLSLLAMHCPLWAFKSFFQLWSQRAIFLSKRPNPHLPLCSGATGCPKLMCELVTFEKNLVAASKKFRFYTIKCSKYQKNLGRKCQF